MSTKFWASPNQRQPYVEVPLYHYRGDGGSDKTITFAHTFGASGNIAEARFMVRTKATGVLVFGLSLSADASQWSFATSNVGVITLLAADTDGVEAGVHEYDIELEHTDGRVTTFQRGDFKLEADVSNSSAGGGMVSLLDEQLKAWAFWLPDYMLTSITYHGTYTYVPSSATITWPDGSSGTYTTTSYDATHEEWAAFTATHTDSGKTVTQTAVTRDASGRITTRPAMTVA